MTVEIPQFEVPNYTLLSRLGEGATAEVWLAEHKRNRRKAAIKILKRSMLSHLDAEALFLRDGEVLAGFDHSNIVKIMITTRSAILPTWRWRCYPAARCWNACSAGRYRLAKRSG